LTKKFLLIARGEPVLPFYLLFVLVCSVSLWWFAQAIIRSPRIRRLMRIVGINSNNDTSPKSRFSPKGTAAEIGVELFGL
jgi:hypothetical protein